MKLTNLNLLYFSLREAFLDILPYYVLSSIGVLLVDVLKVDIQSMGGLIESLLYISDTFAYVFPIILVISISNHLAKNHHVHRLSVGILAFLIYISVGTEFNNGMFSVKEHGMVYAFITPILALYSYKYISKIKFLSPLGQEDVISLQLKTVVNSLLPICIIYLLFASIFPLVSDEAYTIISDFISKSIEDFPLNIKALFQLIITEIAWWTTGIHGIHIYNIFADTSYGGIEILPNLKLNAFLFNFVFVGGVGATFSLVLAIILFSKNVDTKKIAYIALPFAFFNINEILLFGLPIIMNVRFIVPFLIVPLVNFFSSYIFLSYYPIGETSYVLSWATPTLVSGYFLGDGQNFTYMYLQGANLILDFLIYLPFLKDFDELHKFKTSVKTMKDKFGVKFEIEKSEEINFLKTQSDIIQEQQQIKTIINDITKGELLLYYQPKVNIKSSVCYGFEALLRFKNEKGDITGPTFISELENAGYSYILDLWVIDKLCEDLRRWDREEFHPRVSINLSPETICNQRIIIKLIQRLKHKNIEVEILERTFANKSSGFLKNVVHLRKNGFLVSIDDFGTGFSSLQYLHSLPVDIIKLDRAMLQNTQDSRGRVLYKHIADVCKNLDYVVVSEGVENDEDLEFIKSVGIDIAQGFYYSPAIEYKKVKAFCDKLHKSTLI